ncbi:hypothetical protein Ciccas_008163 [Cichlidogyrus casuarinus]|uniref:Uncharacterized protein n=1 Tax=Cichlidogyrus casuarinus TaxID=1844966 RepID=A0ABD2Q0R6_9PLAT
MVPSSSFQEPHVLIVAELAGIQFKSDTEAEDTDEPTSNIKFLQMVPDDVTKIPRIENLLMDGLTRYPDPEDDCVSIEEEPNGNGNGFDSDSNFADDNEMN